MTEEEQLTNEASSVKETKARKKTKKSAKKEKVSFVDIISGEFLLKGFIMENLPFVIFIIFLGLLTVSKGYYAKQLEQNINSLQKQLDAVTTDYVESKARLEEETSRGNLLENLEEVGLMETTNPVKVIRVEKENE